MKLGAARRAFSFEDRQESAPVRSSKEKAGQGENPVYYA